MGATVTTISPLLRPNVSGASASLVYQGTDFINWLRSKGRFVAKIGGAPFRWNLATAENTSGEIYVENQALPAAGNRSYAQAVLQAFYARAVASVTGHVMDNQRNGGVYEDPEQAELASATREMFLEVEDALLGSTYGMPLVIDAGDTYAALDPAVYTAWAATETAVGGALSYAVLDTLYQTLVSKGSIPSDILADINQKQRYADLALIGAQLAQQRLVTGVDGGSMQGVVAYNGIPFTAITRMTNSELYMLDVNSGTFQASVHRDVEVKPLAITNDNQSWQVSMALALEVGRRDLQGKLTGLTT